MHKPQSSRRSAGVQKTRSLKVLLSLLWLLHVLLLAAKVDDVLSDEQVKAPRRCEAAVDCSNESFGQSKEGARAKLRQEAGQMPYIATGRAQIVGMFRARRSFCTSDSSPFRAPYMHFMFWYFPL